MEQLFITTSRYLFVMMIMLFVMSSGGMVYYLNTRRMKRVKLLYYFQKLLISGQYTIGFIALLVTTNDAIDHVILYTEGMLLFVFVWFVIERVYKKTNLLIWNICIYLSSISIVILARLDLYTGVRQFRIMLVGYFLLLLIPAMMRYISFLNRLPYVYVAASFILLLLPNSSMNGSRNWFSVGEFSFQPSELVKLSYIFFVAAYFSYKDSRMRRLITGVITAVMMLILVWQRDLGTALIFYALFITLVFVISGNILYVILGLGAGGVGAVTAYYLFSHIRVRVEALINPWAKIDAEGYQIAQSLFAISNGKVIGTGLNQGNPRDIPVVITDFIYSAISEEFGNVFAICLILIYLILFISIFDISKKCKKYFHLIILVGISAIIAFQSILIIGGVTKLLPLTGVTLPFISYGGSSLMSVIIMVGIAQGIYYKEHSRSKKQVKS